MISAFSATLANLLERPDSAVDVRLIATALLRDQRGQTVGLIEAGPTELGAIRTTCDGRTLTIPATLATIEAIERDPDCDAALEAAFAIAEAWGAPWSWPGNPAAQRIWCDPLRLNTDPMLTSPIVR